MPRYNIELGHGPRDAEDAVLRRVRELRRDAAADGGLLATPPLLIVVPSRSLRTHLLCRLAARGGPTIGVGVRCATVFGVAAELAGAASTTLPEPVGVLAERFARDEPALRALAGLRDGYGIVAGAIRDLLDAGFQPAHLDGLEEALEQPEARSAGRTACRRAAALLRVAARVDRACEEANLPARYRIFRRAADTVLGGRGPRLQAVLVHGFAEATGVVSDLLEALLKVHGGALTLERPRDPFTPERLAGDGRFSKRLLDRLRGATASVGEAPGEEPLPRPSLLVATRPEAEIEEVAHRVLDLIAAGRTPEEIGVVMRDPAAYRLSLRRRFDALGVPFSTTGIPGASLPHRRCLRSLLALLEEGERMPVERWLELLPEASGATAGDLALALTARGAARLTTAAAVGDDLLRGEAPVPLPIRRARGDQTPEASSGGKAASPGDGRRPTIPRSALRQVVERARVTVRALERLRRRQSLHRHLEALRALVDEALAWPPHDAARRTLEDAALAPAATLPSDWTLDLDEVRRLLADLLADAGRQELGGAGAGVRVLDVVAARGHTFEHLFLLGMQRGRFPRQVREDPLLPDAVREVLATHGFGPLPDLPRKRTGHEEEAHLFAQLLNAAPVVSLSWSLADTDGEPLSPSPWIDRLQGVAGLAVDSAPPVWGDPAGGGETVRARLSRRPPEEWLRLAGLHASRADVARLLPHAAATVLAADAPDAAILAGARLAILEELDPDLDSPSGQATWHRPGPYSGLVGSLPEGLPPAADSVWVTGLEAMARCPWQHFLEHTLRLEAWPDPLTDVPGLDAALVGRFVHTILQRLVVDAGGAGEASLEVALAAGAKPVPWPPPEALERLLADVARQLLADEGIHLPGLARGLIERGRPMIERARVPHWNDGPPAVFGSELEDAIEVAGRSVRFRADMAIVEDAAVRLVDFKTGAPLSAAKQESTRHAHLLAAVARGEALQAAVYAASPAERPVAGGAYHYLSERADPATGTNLLKLDAGDTEGLDSMRLAATRLLEARRLGVHPPRLTQPEPGDDRTPRACGWCAVRQACLQGETTARARQRQWVDAHQQPSAIAPALERALATLWWMWDAKWPRRFAGEES